MIDPDRDAPDLEDLAAYVDGRLAGERKAQVEERLLRDEDYYEVFLQSVRFLEEQAESGGEVVAPPAWRRSWRLAAPLAVAAALVAVIGLWRLGSGPSIDAWVAGLDAAAVVQSGDRWDDPGWERSRGMSRAGLSQEQTAFRIGTHVVDLRVALAGDDRAAAGGAAAQLANLTSETIDLLQFSGAYADLNERIDRDALAGFLDDAAELEAYLAEALKDSAEAGYYLVGKWNEAGRLAAAGGDAEALAGIFRQRDGRLAPWKRFPAHLLTGNEIAPLLEKIAAVVTKPNPGREDFQAAAGAFSEIARALAGRV